MALGPVASMISSAPPNGYHFWVAVRSMISFGLWVPRNPTNLSVFFSKQMVNSPEVSLRHVDFVLWVEMYQEDTRRLAMRSPDSKAGTHPACPQTPNILKLSIEVLGNSQNQITVVLCRCRSSYSCHNVQPPVKNTICFQQCHRRKTSMQLSNA